MNGMNNEGNARHGIGQNQPRHVLLSNEDIKKDASKIRPYDHLWDMYYDEFEDEVESGRTIKWDK